MQKMEAILYDLVEPDDHDNMQTYKPKSQQAFS